MQLNCQETQKKLSDWLELSDQDDGAVREHTDHCPNCREELIQIEQFYRQLKVSRRTYQMMSDRGRLDPFKHARGEISLSSSIARSKGIRSRGILLILVMGIMLYFVFRIDEPHRNDQVQVRIQEKYKQAKGKLPLWTKAGGDPEKILLLMQQLDKDMEDSQYKQAEKILDQILKILNDQVKNGPP